MRKILIYLGLLLLGGQAQADGPRLGEPEQRFRQLEFLANPPLVEVRRAGLRVFATPFNHADGYGDGPMNPDDPLSSGGRPTLANNGTFLRVNGLDGQSCVDCHALVSSRSVPPRFGVGGFGGINDVPILKPTVMDVTDVSDAGFAFTDGRVIVPPHLFGSGAIQLLAEEMTASLLALRDEAVANPGRGVALRTHGVDFGFLSADAAGNVDTSAVIGVDGDLVIRPFGRKGEFETVRAFAANAMQFHFGMQPVEMVGSDVDDDGDGVSNELFVGEISALEIFITTMERPFKEAGDASARAGAAAFRRAGCDSCHQPELTTSTSLLSYRDPGTGAPYYEVDLTEGPAGVARSRAGGLSIPLYSDLKRHDMGPALAETFGEATARQNREFITARLWGVSDSAPYLHDGRALSIDEAIRWHGGEAEAAKNAYVAFDEAQRESLVAFLRALRLPQRPNRDVVDP